MGSRGAEAAPGTLSGKVMRRNVCKPATGSSDARSKVCGMRFCETKIGKDRKGNQQMALNTKGVDGC